MKKENEHRSKKQSPMENKIDNCKHGHCDRDKQEKSYH